MVVTVLSLLGMFITSAVILFIVIRKFPSLAAVNPSTLPHVQQQKVKDILIAERITRIFFRIVKRFENIVPPIQRAWKYLQGGFRRLFRTLLTRYQELEIKKKVVSLKQGTEGGALTTRVEELVTEADRLRKENGPFEQTEKMYIEAIALNTHASRAYMGLGKLYFREEKYKEAKDVFEFLTKLAKEDDLPVAFLGRIAKIQGEYIEAATYFERALRMKDTLVKRWMDLSEVYERLERPEDARSAAESAAALEPNNPLTLDRLVYCSIQSGDKNKAREVLARLKEVNPENQHIEFFEKQFRKMRRKKS